MTQKLSDHKPILLEISSLFPSIQPFENKMWEFLPNTYHLKKCSMENIEKYRSKTENLTLLKLSLLNQEINSIIESNWLEILTYERWSDQIVPPF